MRVVIAAMLLALPWTAYGAFDDEHRSINGTGETLAKGAYELGSTGLSYGIDDDLLLQMPATSLLFARGSLAAKYRVKGEHRRITPGLEIGSTAYVAGGADFGWDLGESYNHSVTLTPKLYLERRAMIYEGRSQRRWVVSLELNGEYDFYHAGNLVFVGLISSLPFVGYTWGFESFYCGLVSSPRSYFIPFPFVYWRF